MSSSEATSSSTHRATPSTPNITEPGLISKKSPTQPPGDGFVFDVFPPEIQTEIFSYLVDDHKTLVLAALVSKAWYACFVDLLWRDASKARLDRISPDRQQYYADRICSLTLDMRAPVYLNLLSNLDRNPSMKVPRDPTLWSSFSQASIQAPTFPLLKRLQIASSRITLRPYLSSGLCSLHLDTCYFDMNTLDLIALCCPHLQTLELIDCGLRSNISDGVLDYFLHNFRSTRHLQIHNFQGNYGRDTIIGPGCTTALQLETLSVTDEYGMYAACNPRCSEWVNDFILRCIPLREFAFEPGDSQVAISTESFSYLSTSKLEVLRLDQWFERGFVDECLEMFYGAYRLRNIQRLSLRGESSAIIALMPDAPNTLVELDLLVDDGIQGISQTIGRFSMLKSLSLSFYPTRQISLADLNNFSALSKLRRLRILKAESKMMKHNIYPRKPHLLDAIWLTDHDFEQWICSFPLLCDLHLGFNCPAVTGQSIPALANSCPLLKSCELLWKQDLEERKFPESLLFPNLEALYFGELKIFDAPKAKQYAAMIKSLAPGLKRLTVRTQDLAARILEKWFQKD